MGNSCRQPSSATMSGIVYPPKAKGCARGTRDSCITFYAKLYHASLHWILSCAGCLSSPDSTDPQSCAPVRTGLQYIQTVNADALNLKVESLQAQLVEQRHLFREQVEALKQDRHLLQQVRLCNSRQCFAWAVAFYVFPMSRCRHMVPCWTSHAGHRLAQAELPAANRRPDNQNQAHRGSTEKCHHRLYPCTQRQANCRGPCHYC
jgi:hypothetical protein